MKDPATRKRIAREMLEQSDEWENPARQALLAAADEARPSLRA